MSKLPEPAHLAQIKAVIDAVEFDSRQGGGLLSVGTLRRTQELRLLLDRLKAAQALDARHEPVA